MSTSIDGRRSPCTANTLLNYCRAERDWVLDTTRALARIESPTTDKSAVDRCGCELERRMASIGGVVTRCSQSRTGDHLRAEFGSGADQILMIGHYDTVWPIGQVDRMPIEIRDGRLFGPGVLDMKGGIAIGMLAARALRDVAPVNVRLVMLWTSDEERGSVTSRALVEEEAGRSRAVFVLEPALDGGGVKTSRKGCGEFQLTVRGIAAHAGVNPDAGASAVHELAAQIVDLQRVRGVAPGVTLNVGLIEGGTRPNVVAEEARAIIDVRVATIEEAKLVHAMVYDRVSAVPGTTIEIRGSIDRPPLERTGAVVRLYEKARDIAARLGYDLPEGGTGGGSDGNFTAALGVPTLDGLGAVGAGPHALDEHIEVDALPWRAALLAGLIAETAADASDDSGGVPNAGGSS